MRHVSALPGQEEVLFPPNPFRVDIVVTSAADKATVLNRLTAWDLPDLDVYVTMQVAEYTRETGGGLPA